MKNTLFIALVTVLMASGCYTNRQADLHLMAGDYAVDITSFNNAFGYSHTLWNDDGSTDTLRITGTMAKCAQELTDYMPASADSYTFFWHKRAKQTWLPNYVMRVYRHDGRAVRRDECGSEVLRAMVRERLVYLDTVYATPKELVVVDTVLWVDDSMVVMNVGFLAEELRSKGLCYTAADSTFMVIQDAWYSAYTCRDSAALQEMLERCGLAVVPDTLHPKAMMICIDRCKGKY